MTSKTSFALTLAALSFIFISGILAIFTAYSIRGSADNFKYKLAETNKSLRENDDESMEMRYE